MTFLQLFHFCHSCKSATVLRRSESRAAARAVRLSYKWFSNIFLLLAGTCKIFRKKPFHFLKQTISLFEIACKFCMQNFFGEIFLSPGLASLFFDAKPGSVTNNLEKLQVPANNFLLLDGQQFFIAGRWTVSAPRERCLTVDRCS